MQKLKLNISNLEKAQQIAKIGNWELDYIEDKLTWSNEIYNILEINPESYKPSYKTTFQFVHPEDWEMVKKTFETSKKENKDYSIVFRMLLKNNHILIYLFLEQLQGHPKLSLNDTKYYCAMNLMEYFANSEYHLAQQCLLFLQ